MPLFTLKVLYRLTFTHLKSETQKKSKHFITVLSIQHKRIKAKHLRNKDRKQNASERYLNHTAHTNYKIAGQKNKWYIKGLLHTNLTKHNLVVINVIYFLQITYFSCILC